MKTIRKIACVLITALLVLATGVTGLSHGFTARAEGDCAITITNAKAGETYSAYKIFDVSASDDESAYSYKVVENWSNFIAGYKYCNCSDDCEACESCKDCCSEDGCCSGQYQQCTCAEECTCGCCVNLFTLSEDGYLSANSAVFNLSDDSEVLIYFAAAAEAYAKTYSITASATATCSTGEESATISNLDPGWYLVTGTASSTICMLETVTSSAEIADKFGEPTLEKKILEGNELLDEETVNNKEEVTYQITLSDVYGASNLVLHDALPDGLTLGEVISVTLYADSSDGTGTTLTKDTDYTVSTGESCSEKNPPFSSGYSCSFEINFSKSYDTIIATGSDAYIVITYTCTVDATEGTYTGDVESLINEAVASYGDNSWTTEDTAEVDTFEFKIDKVNNSDTPLEGAQFTLQKQDEDGNAGDYAAFTTGSNGEYVFSEWSSSTEGKNITLVSGSDGKIVVQGMDAGTYILTETEAPAGYNLLGSPITITIAYSDGTYTLTVDNSESSGNVTASDHTIKVVNNTGSILPGTGGIGTTIFYIVGGVIIIVAVVLLVTRRRVGAKDDK